MTKVGRVSHLAAANAIQLNDEFSCGGSSTISAPALKRKTPSELRGELLKRKNSVELIEVSPDSVLGSDRNNDVTFPRHRKSFSSKVPRYIDTRMDGLFPVTKNSITSKLLSKRNLFRRGNMTETIYSESGGSQSNFGVNAFMDDKHQVKNSCFDATISPGAGRDPFNPGTSTNEKAIKIIFQSVRELSLGGDESNDSPIVDMNKALKGLMSVEPDSVPQNKALKELAKPNSFPADFAMSSDNIRYVTKKSFCSEIRVPGNSLPLDLTLKTNMRLLCSSSVNWFHRLIHRGTSNWSSQVNFVITSQNMRCSSEPMSTSQTTNAQTFHSWVYPQLNLTRSAVAALTAIPDFMSKRQREWEDAFRCLYYMFRRKLCKLFYVCTEQFIVMFMVSDDSTEMKNSCFAYVSRSSTRFRTLIKEQGATFSMPLFYGKVDDTCVEDLVELSEIKKHDLVQIQASEIMTGVENNPQSLLVFTGSKNVHVLYDILLNYRFFLNTLVGCDVPLLYSPVPFENAAISAPEVRCKQVRRADSLSSQIKDSDQICAPCRNSSDGVIYSVEIKAAYLPPWVVSSICDAMRSKENDFQASFMTAAASMGLNFGLNSVKVQQPSQGVYSFGIRNTTRCLNLQFAFLKGLKYSDGSYTASLSSVE